MNTMVPLPLVSPPGASSGGGWDTVSVLDLFAGAGGLTQGFREADDRFRTVQAVEMDQEAAATYRENHKCPVHVGTIEEWLRDGEVPEADVIVGGPPCQGFSTLGKQDAEDHRNTLWSEYATTILRARPKYFVVENVAAFLKSPQFQQFHESTDPGERLADWTFQARVLNAADYGAAQARKRAVIIGHHRDLPFPGWPERTHGEHPKTVRDVLGRVPWEWDAIELPERTTLVDGSERPGVFRTRELHVGRCYSPVSLQRFVRIPPGGNRFDLPEHLKAPCWRKHRSGSADVMGRLRWDRPSVTIRTEFHKPEKGRYLHPEANRALTHYEAALLQGFPEDYRWIGSKVAIARQIGNAVPMPLGAAVARQLLAALAG